MNENVPSSFKFQKSFNNDDSTNQMLAKMISGNYLIECKEKIIALKFLKPNF